MGAALFPKSFTTLLPRSMLRKFADMLGIDGQRGYDERHREILRRIDEVLQDED